MPEESITNTTSTFTKEELSCLKLLVLSELNRYEVDEAQGGHLHDTLKQLVTKLNYIKEDTFPGRYHYKMTDDEIASMFYEETLDQQGVKNYPPLFHDYSRYYRRDSIDPDINNPDSN
tara:strand:- start:48004 stop:48357 length:354 start_codon:yes stop_codon:yes gene_type:complete